MGAAGEGDGGRSAPVPMTTCARCGRAVGLVMYRGRSTLIDGPVKAGDAGQLVMQRHACPAAAPGPSKPAGRPGRYRR